MLLILEFLTCDCQLVVVKHCKSSGLTGMFCDVVIQNADLYHDLL
jgi:hypothetical protein